MGWFSDLLSDLLGSTGWARQRPHGRPDAEVPYTLTATQLEEITSSTRYQERLDTMQRLNNAGEYLIVGFKGDGTQVVFFRCGIGDQDFFWAREYFRMNRRTVIVEGERRTLQTDHPTTTLYHAYWVSHRWCRFLGEFYDWSAADWLFTTCAMPYARHERLVLHLLKPS